MTTAFDKIKAGLKDAIAYMDGDDTRGRAVYPHQMQILEQFALVAVSLLIGLFGATALYLFAQML